jgi:hypothetical protein
MRTFLALFPSIYLVDNIPFWILYGLFFRWYDDSSSWDSFLTESVVALVLASFMRLLQKRPAILFGPWIARRLDDTETLRNIATSIVLLFPGLLGYRDVIELTGSPSESDQMPLGRIRSMVLISMMLVGIYAFEKQWSGLLGPESNLHLRDESGKTSPAGISYLRNNKLQSHWLLYLNAILGVAILIDICLVQTVRLTYPLVFLLGGFLVIFMACNICWSKSVSRAEADATVIGAPPAKPSSSKES